MTARHAVDLVHAAAAEFLNPATLLRSGGRIVAITPTHFRVRGLAGSAQLGDIVTYRTSNGTGRGEVVLIESPDVTIAPYDDTNTLKIGEPVFTVGQVAAHPSTSWLGRIVNALGQPADGLGPLLSDAQPDRGRDTLHAISRSRVRRPFQTGIRVVDVFTPLCFGQRFGVFAGSGVGKSTLLAMFARAEAFDVVVVALVGERSREVREFVEDTLGPDNLAKSVIVVATSDESAMMRRRAPECAMDIAAYFRGQGKSVLLLVDSLTRYAHALREVAIAAGEPPVARGYPSSVFTHMPRLLERAGTDQGGGSITSIISVLVDGDDHNDPVSDAARGILDGHLVLDRGIADEGRFPAVNVQASISRLAEKVWTPEQRGLVLQLRSMIARFEDTRDLRTLGGWTPGQDVELDTAVTLVPKVNSFLNQAPSDTQSVDPFAELLEHLKQNDAPNEHPQQV